MKKFFILIVFLSCLLFAGCAANKKVDNSIMKPEKPKKVNDFIYEAQSSQQGDTKKQDFTKWIISSGTASVLIFKILHWKNIV